MEILDIKKELEASKKIAEQELLKVALLAKIIKEREANISATADFIDERTGKLTDKQAFLDFFKKPYVLIPNGKNSVLVCVPKFIKDFQVGWLWKETESFYIYQFDQYSAWLGDAPEELKKEINFKNDFNVVIDGNILRFNPGQKAFIKQKFDRHLSNIEDGTAKITRGHIFDVIAESVENGCLPFKPIPVAESDIRQQKSTIKLRPYQKKAIDRFLETGAVGVFHPTGAGKSFISLYLLDIIKGEKIIIVPTKTLIEQWKIYIEMNVPHIKDEVKIVTYQGYRDNDKKYTLTIYDECQRLPANTFSRLAVIDTKYRLGLSASPHREDGRENYIFALTGFPVGLNWQEYMTTVGKRYHPIFVHIVRSSASKMKKLEELFDPKKKTMIFCDTISLGKQIGNRFSIPYIYGQTENRMEKIQEHNAVCISRVGDLGISVKNLQRIIEIDFLFGSRQQELQRSGRLLHSEDAERHDILMTELEFKQYGKRIWALQEKGFTIKIV